MDLTDAQRAAWERDGYFVLPGFADTLTCRAMLDRCIELARGSAARGAALVMPEARENPRALAPEDRISKVFKLHREGVFQEFARQERLLGLLAGLIGDGLDCFLSQFIFKSPGAMGQPLHQDSHYFRFDRTPQVGVWLAVSEATRENGCLHVIPGSHREPVHAHVPDRRPGANLGYLEIVDCDATQARPVVMRPGDLLVFHSHLMHRSTDNLSPLRRAAMVYHYAQAGTKDLAATPSVINDWLPVRRRVDTCLEIEADVDATWQALLDLKSYRLWNPYLVEVEGEARSGQKIQVQAVQTSGQVDRYPVEVVSAERYRMRWDGGLRDRSLFHCDHHFELEALGPERTLLRHYEIFTGILLEQLIVGRESEVAGNFSRMNRGLKRWLEIGIA